MLNVIVATDMSEAGLLGVESVFGCGPTVFGEVTLVHVVDLDLYTAGGSIPGIIEFSQDRLAQEVARLSEVGITADAVVTQGDVVDTINRLAEERNADAVLVTNVGENALAGRVLGTVAERIAVASKVPVFVQRVDLEGEVPSCRIDDRALTSRVLVAVDFDEAATQLLSFTAALPGVEAMRVVHVATEAGPLTGLTAAVEELEALAARASLAARADTRVIVTDDAARAIADEAAAWDATLIAVGVRAHGVIHRIRHGSVAGEVVRGSDRSVLLVSG